MTDNHDFISGMPDRFSAKTRGSIRYRRKRYMRCDKTKQRMGYGWSIRAQERTITGDFCRRGVEMFEHLLREMENCFYQPRVQSMGKWICRKASVRNCRLSTENNKKDKRSPLLRHKGSSGTASIRALSINDKTQPSRVLRPKIFTIFFSSLKRVACRSRVWPIEIEVLVIFPR